MFFNMFQIYSVSFCFCQRMSLYIYSTNSDKNKNAELKFSWVNRCCLKKNAGTVTGTSLFIRIEATLLHFGNWSSCIAFILAVDRLNRHHEPKNTLFDLFVIVAWKEGTRYNLVKRSFYNFSKFNVNLEKIPLNTQHKSYYLHFYHQRSWLIFTHRDYITEIL